MVSTIGNPMANRPNQPMDLCKRPGDQDPGDNQKEPRKPIPEADTAVGPPPDKKASASRADEPMVNRKLKKYGLSRHATITRAAQNRATMTPVGQTHRDFAGPAAADTGGGTGSLGRCFNRHGFSSPETSMDVQNGSAAFRDDDSRRTQPPPVNPMHFRSRAKARG